MVDKRIRIGYQIPNFSYPDPLDPAITGPDSNIFPTVAAQVREAEAAGFDTVFVMDHFYQLPGIGAPSEPMLESYTTLLAATRRLPSSCEFVPGGPAAALVTGNTYRNPAMLAKTVTTLDVVSGGRAVLAIGAGWFQLEHDQMGFEFGTFTDRFERLSEALEIISPMLRGGRPELDGKWYRAHGTLNRPRLRDDLPIMLGGGGEKKTFGLAARYADHLNVICNASELPRKLDALAARCEETGRDRDTLETSFLSFVMMDTDGDRARSLAHDYLRKSGVDPDTLDDETYARATDRMFIGTPDDVAEQLQRRVLDPGIDGIVVNMVANGHVPGQVTEAGTMLRALLN
ncbi:TIGR03560 family F420-dependent LLM class oxidoreductase [Gordonia neofelifaecis]|uniref:5,10-methylenetetrahydromethanopterin reductase n=1 Tax=Gordonia neofelifaecis NRRL B-59395 TaxID=644548 RepID=F1YFY2_9ACTN|nr:TIGR03560 family F420-dependent LLM class oxidoreductase [Gordonia neofelifaecis]EGD56559.1 5,10-methylenetetrahydromethanopterin reductase [Gordonia neofelifaecis NRRL B-59395]